MISVIISTYNQPEWLKKVLWGYEQQTFKRFEIIIADDGSTEKTADMIECFLKESNLKIRHIWQEDDGFGKTKILNKTIVTANYEYLIFTDGDCIPRKDFVEKHYELRQANCFLSGGYFKLSGNISNTLSEDDIRSQNCFKKEWLLVNGMQKNFKMNKLSSSGFKERMLNRFTTTKATFDGMNASGWKKDIEAVNGFDERMQYGGEDRELGERLMNYGVKPIQIRYSAICLHLFHNRPYKDSKALSKNKTIRKITKKERKVWTDFGILKSR